MQPYQEEYIQNLKEMITLAERKMAAGCSFEEYQERLSEERQKKKEIAERNRNLLRENLFPLFDNLFDAKEEEMSGLEEFAKLLLDGKNELDGGLFCQIHQALLSRARLLKNQRDVIRELYWLGIGRFHMCNKMVGLDLAYTESYMSQMRLCFAEAAAYLKYYDEIEDTQTRGYILRSRANTALGHFKSASAKIRLTRQTLRIMNDKDYQEKEPNLPWDRYIFMTHQQMTSSISYNRENDMTSQDVADIMESAHIVYQRRIQEALSRKETLPIKSAFICDAIEYYCGLYSLDELLAKMELLMDQADTSDFSVESMYGILSLPAFYCQYLREYPEQLNGRQEYLEKLYERAVAYMEAFPEGEANEQIFLFLRQLSSTFLETENSISYGEFQQKLLLCFAPDIFVHGHVVGRTAAALCEVIMDEEPTFFDDIEHICQIQDAQEKRQKVIAYAMECGVFHDVGKVNFMSLFSHTGRQWFEEEYEMVHLHTVVGSSRLSACKSTQHYADAALGHHSWYDGSHGYPENYRRLESPYRQMVDVIGLVDWIDNRMNATWLYGGTERTYEEAVRDAIALEGKRFSPLLTARLRDKKVVKMLRDVFAEGRKEAYWTLYREQQ